MLKDRIKIEDRNKTEMFERIFFNIFEPQTLRTIDPSD